MRRTLSLIATVLCLIGIVLILFTAEPMTLPAFALPSDMVPKDISSSTPVTPTWSTSVADGWTFANDGHCLLYIENNSAVTQYFTVTTPATFYGYAVADLYFSIATTDAKIAGPFSAALFNDSSGDVSIAASAGATTTVKAAVFRY